MTSDYHLDLEHIEDSLKAFKEAKVQSFKSYLLVDEYETRISPDLVEYALRTMIFEYPAAIEIFNMTQIKDRVAFVYDGKDMEELAKALPKDLDWETIKIEGLESFQSLSRYEKIIIATQDKRWASLLYLICADHKIQCVFWDNSKFSPFRFPLMGLSVPKINTKESFEKRFKRVMGPGEIPQKINVSDHFKEVFWKEFYYYAHADFSDAFFHFCEIKKEDEAFNLSIKPFQSSLLQGLALRTNEYGMFYASKLFHPHWYKLFNQKQRLNLQDLAEVCLKLLEADEIKGKLHPRHYIQKGYWSLFTGPAQLAFEIIKQMQDYQAGYAAEMALILCLMGEKNLALEILEKEVLQDLLEPEIIHKGAVASALLGDLDKAKYLYGKLDRDFLLKEGNPEKYFLESLVYRMAGEDDLEKCCIKMAEEKDPLYADKKDLRQLAEPQSSELRAIGVRVLNMPIIDMRIAVA